MSETLVEQLPAVSLDHSPDDVDTDLNKQTDSDKNTDQPESEYDTASSPSDDEEDEPEEVLDDSESDEEDNDEIGLEESETDGEEEEEEEEYEDLQQASQAEEGSNAEIKKKVDDDEDRSNPQYIPKKGTFYEHDDRTAETPDKPDGDEDQEKGDTDQNSSTKAVSPLLPNSRVPARKSSSATDRWSHDRYDMNEQAPKSRAELVSAYGYDIRSEDGPPKVKRNKHYGRGPNKYTRKWEDETAYGKQMVQKRNMVPPQQGDQDFPRLGAGRHTKKSSPGLDREDAESNEEISRYQRRPSSNRRSIRTPDQQGRDSGPPTQNQRFGGRVINNNSREFKNRSKSNRSDQQYRNNNNNNNNNGESSYNGNSMSFTNSNLANHRRNNPDYNSDRFNNNNKDDGQKLSIKPSRSNHTIQAEHQRDEVTPIQYQPTTGNSNNNRSASPNVVEDDLGGLNQPKRYSVKRQRNEGQQQLQQQQQIMNNHVQYSQEEPILTNNNVTNPLPQMHVVQQQPLPAPSLPQMQMQQQQQQVATVPFMDPANLVRLEQYDSQPKATAIMAQQQQQQPPQQSLPPAAQYANYYLPQPNPAQIAQQQFPAQQYQGQYLAQPPQQQPVVQQQQPAPNYLPAQGNPTINYVPAMTQQPQQQQQPPAQAQFTQYSGYQNYTATVAPNVIHQTQGGLTYYAPQAPQALPRPVLPPQRRPIPILAPPERAVGGKGRGRLVAQAEEGQEQQSGPAQTPQNPSSSAEISANNTSNSENIDHILDNMFVRRAPVYPPASGGSTRTEKAPKADQPIEDALKELRVSEKPADLPKTNSPSSGESSEAVVAAPAPEVQTEAGGGN